MTHAATPRGARGSAESDAVRGVVLVVDDSAMNRRILQRSLAEQGYGVLIAEDGGRALDVLRREPVDLVLLDIEMPVLNGYDVLRAMKSDSSLRSIPVVVISALDEQDAAARCIELGAEDVLGKPFNPVLLRARLRASLERKRIHDLEQRYLDALAEAKAHAEQANEAKSSFLANVSHELRTPLTSVLGFAKIARRQLDERVAPAIAGDPGARASLDRIRTALETIAAEGQRLTALIENVLDLAKIEAGRYELRREPVDVADAVARALGATAMLAESKGLRVKRELADGLPPALGDRDAIVQVVVNLVSNAVKFTERGTVTVAVRPEEPGLLVEVRDTGIGLEPAQRETIFEKFVQVADGRADKPRGTGLGLAISREIVERHGGRIGVDSVAGRGSRFWFTLPRADRSPDA